MKRLLTLSALALLLSSPASAAVLHSPPVSSGFSGDYLICLAQNATSSPRLVSLAMLDFAGNPVSGSSSDTLLPGETKSWAANPIPAAASCRFTVAGSAKSLRASAIYYDPETSKYNIVLPAE